MIDWTTSATVDLDSIELTYIYIFTYNTQNIQEIDYEGI